MFQVDEQLSVAMLTVPVVPDDYDSLPAPLRPAILHTVRIIPLSAVRTVKPVEGSSRHEMPAVKAVKVERLLRREQRVLHKRQTQFGSRAPTATSPEAMAIFEALSKTYRTGWPFVLTV